MILCPMCGNFTDHRNCEVCGMKLFNEEDLDKDLKDSDAYKYLADSDKTSQNNGAVKKTVRRK
jgi:hypothetical protein